MISPRHGIAVGPEDLARDLGIEARAESRGADQVDEHHGQLTALGVSRAEAAGSEGRHGGDAGLEGRDRLEQALAVAEIEAELLQVGIGKIAQDVSANPICGERRRVDLETKVGKPLLEVAHPSPRRCPALRHARRPTMRSQCDVRGYGSKSSGPPPCWCVVRG